MYARRQNYERPPAATSRFSGNMHSLRYRMVGELEILSFGLFVFNKNERVTYKIPLWSNLHVVGIQFFFNFCFLGLALYQ
jgi:hypothetical protein